MDNLELYSEIRKLDLELFRLRLNASDQVSKIWLVMIVGVELIVFFVLVFGVGLMHRAYEDSVHEMHGEIMAVRAQAPPQAAHLHPGTVK